jgi:hypothetical protein
MSRAMVDIDQLVGRISEEGRPAVRRGPSCRRIARRDELGRHLTRRAKRCIVEHGEIFLDCTPGRIRWQTRGPFNAGAVASVGLDQTGIDGKAFAADQPFEPHHELTRGCQKGSPPFASRCVEQPKRRVLTQQPVTPSVDEHSVGASDWIEYGQMKNRDDRPVRPGPIPVGVG